MFGLTKKKMFFKSHFYLNILYKTCLNKTTLVFGYIYARLCLVCYKVFLLMSN